MSFQFVISVKINKILWGFFSFFFFFPLMDYPEHSCPGPELAISLGVLLFLGEMVFRDLIIFNSAYILKFKIIKNLAYIIKNFKDITVKNVCFSLSKCSITIWVIYWENKWMAGWLSGYSLNQLISSHLLWNYIKWPRELPLWVELTHCSPFY